MADSNTHNKGIGTFGIRALAVGCSRALYGRTETLYDGEMGSPARQVAFDVLLRVARDEKFASDELRSLSARLDSRDAGLASEIVFGCLRYQAQLDHLIPHFAGKSVACYKTMALRFSFCSMVFLIRRERGFINTAETPSFATKGRGSGEKCEQNVIAAACLQKQSVRPLILFCRIFPMLFPPIT